MSKTKGERVAVATDLSVDESLRAFVETALAEADARGEVLDRDLPKDVAQLDLAKRRIEARIRAGVAERIGALLSDRALARLIAREHAEHDSSFVLSGVRGWGDAVVELAPHLVMMDAAGARRMRELLVPDARGIAATYSELLALLDAYLDGGGTSLAGLGVWFGEAAGRVRRDLH